MTTISVTDRDPDLRRAARWLRNHGLDAVPTPLLAARLAARRQAMTGLVVMVMVAVVVLTVERGWWLVTSTPTSPASAAPSLAGLVMGTVMGTVMLAVVVVRGLSMRWVARAERRLGATLAVRAAHVPSAGWRTIMGTRRLWVTAVLYGGSTAVAVAAISFAESAEATTMAIVLLGAIAALAAVTCFEIAGIMRRPCLAEDTASLRVDDVLRAADIQASTTPLLPALLAASTVSQGGGQYPAWLLLGTIALSTLVLVEIIWSAAAAPRSTASAAS